MLRETGRLLAGACVLVTLCLAPMLFTSQVYWGSGTDLPGHYYPLRHHFAESCLRQGVWPLWCPYVFNGIPYQTGLRSLAYPANWLLLVLSAGAQIKLTLWLHCVLATFLTAAWLRWNGLQRWSSLLGGLTMGCSGFMLARMFAGHLDFCEAVGWVPGLAWSLQAASRYRGVGWTCLSGGCLAVMVVAGHYQVAYLALYGICGFQVVLVALGSRFAVPRLNWRSPWERAGVDRAPDAGLDLLAPGAARGTDLAWLVVRLALVAAVGLGLALFVLLPSAEVLRASNRLRPGSFDDGPPVASFLTFLVPQFFDGTTYMLCWSRWPSWEAQAYLGLVTLCCLLRALTGPRRVWLAQGLTVLFFLGVAAGASSPLFQALRAVDPLLVHFRAPTRFLLVVTLYGSWLAALGAQQARAWRGWWLLPATPLVLVLVGLNLPLTSWSAFVQSYCAPAAWPLLNQAQPDNLQGLWITNQTRAWGAALLMAATLALLASPRARPALLGLLVLDLALFARPYLKTVPEESLRLPPPLVDWLQANLGSQRVFWDPQLNWICRGAAYGVAEVGGFAPFGDSSYTGAANLAEARPYNSPVFVLYPAGPGALWSLQGARFFVTAGGRWGDYPQVADLGGVRIYRNPAAFERAWFVHKTQVQSLEETAALAASDAEPFRSKAFLTQDAPALSGQAGSEPVTTRVGVNSVECEVEADSEGMLVLSDSPFPGWRARLDGQPVRLHAVNAGLHRGVVVPPGRHRVSFAYWPDRLTWGVAGSALTCLVLAVVLGGPRQPRTPVL